MELLKETMTSFRSKVRLQQEPVDLFETALDIFDQVNSHGAKKAFFGKDAEYTYFYEQFVPGIIRTLLQ